LVFILAGAFLISGLITGIFYIDMLLSLLVIAVGFHGILEAVSAKENRNAYRKIDASLQQLYEWFQKSHLFAKSMQEKHELRLHNLDTKRGQLEQKLERKSKELTTRMIYLENKYNSLQKAFAAERPRPPSTFERRVGRAITVLRKDGMINPVTYSSRIRVSRTLARSDLKKMAGMNIVRKRGSGRNSYYILAI
ncbi:MAG TPA: hypothetical protein VJ485_03305, partial [archaeon]|nr:hypothetical protein [archaeon]